MSKFETLHLFKNEDVTITDQEVHVHWYYFPTGSSKHIRFDEILKVELVPMAEMSFFSLKTWGMGLSNIWWHCDHLRHLSRAYVLILTLKTQSIRVGITTDDAQIHTIYSLIRKMMGEQADQD